MGLARRYGCNLIALFLSVVLFLAVTVYVPEANAQAQTQLRIGIEAIEYSPESTDFELIFTLGSKGPINYMYDWTLPKEQLKPRILMYLQEAYDGRRYDNVVIEGVYSKWKPIESITPEYGRQLDWVQSGSRFYRVATDSSRLFFPFESSYFLFYFAANGVQVARIDFCRTRVAFKVIRCTLTEIQWQQVPKMLQGRIGSEDKDAYTYDHFYKIEIELENVPWYPIMLGTLSFSILALTVAPLLCAVLFKISIVDKHSPLRVWKRMRNKWKDIVPLYVVFLFTYRTAFAPRWLTWIDVSAGVGIVVWTSIATYDLFKPSPEEVSDHT
mgnify:CR=1 FL=1